jgi:hypothetical protein
MDTNRTRLQRIYTNYRDAAMSKEYYACRLAQVKRWNIWYEIVLALGASGTAVAGWYIWSQTTGKIVWAIFSGCAAVLAIIKPILKVADEVERYSKLHIGYSELAFDYKLVCDEIRASGGISESLREAVANADKRIKELTLVDDVKPSLKLLRECQNSVKRVVPGFDEWLSISTT